MFHLPAQPTLCRTFPVLFYDAGKHLSKSLKNSGLNIIQIYSKTENSARTLAKALNSNFTTVPQNITTDAEIYIVALKDSAFDKVLSKTDLKNKILVHCSGSLPLSVLAKYSNKSGVLYPLQTFSKQREVDFRDIPVFVESHSQETRNLLVGIARRISDSVSVLNSEKRKIRSESAKKARKYSPFNKTKNFIQGFNKEDK